MSTDAPAAHVIFNCKVQAMECKHCGERRALPTPVTLTRAAELMEAFATLHEDCPPRALTPG